MSYKSFRMIQGLIGIVLGITFGVSLAMNNWMVPLVAFAIGIAVELILRRSIRDIIADERTYTIVGKAGWLTVQLGTIIMAGVGLVLLGISRDSSSLMGQSTITLCLATCGLLVIHNIAYIYYKGKLGGKE